jgi:3-methyladenine DNA glycosylase AlkD
MPDPVSDLVRLVRDRLADAADPERAEPMRAYMKSAMPYRGVTSVPLRTICRTTYDEHPLPDRDAWESCVRELWDGATYREERYAAMALTRHRLYRVHQDPGTLDLYRHLVVSGAWWDFVDSLASHNVGDLLVAHPAEVTPVVRRWAVDDDLWLRRTAMICQLHRKDATDVDLLREVLEANLESSRHGREFFVRKALGWALRQHARVDPDWVRAFVAEHEDDLSGLSRREALKHL